MPRQKKDKDMIHFSGRSHPKLGIASMIIGILVVVGFLTISIISGILRGKGGSFLGVAGIVLFCMSVIGFIFSYKAYQQKDIFLRFPLIGLFLNSIMTILLLIIYLLGFGG